LEKISLNVAIYETTLQAKVYVIYLLQEVDVQHKEDSAETAYTDIKNSAFFFLYKYERHLLLILTFANLRVNRRSYNCQYEGSM